jgi:ribonuclease HI
MHTYIHTYSYRCSNNQAEQLAIAKALVLIHDIDIAENTPRTIGIFTDSRTTVDSIRNANNHSYLNEEIRKNILNLERTNCTIEFSWVTAHVGIHGNELAGRLTEVAACSTEIPVVFDRIPKSALYSELEEVTQKWQEEWEQCKKAAVTKQFFPTVQDRINPTLNVNPSFTATVTGHGETRAYVHRFKIKDSATCSCNKEDQTLDHILYKCTLHKTHRDLFKEKVLKSGS